MVRNDISCRCIYKRTSSTVVSCSHQDQQVDTRILRDWRANCHASADQASPKTRLNEPMAAMGFPARDQWPKQCGSSTVQAKSHIWRLIIVVAIIERSKQTTKSRPSTSHPMMPATQEQIRHLIPKLSPSRARLRSSLPRTHDTGRPDFIQPRELFDTALLLPSHAASSKG